MQNGPIIGTPTLRPWRPGGGLVVSRHKGIVPIDNPWWDIRRGDGSGRRGLRGLGQIINGTGQYTINMGHGLSGFAGFSDQAANWCNSLGVFDSGWVNSATASTSPNLVTACTLGEAMSRGQSQDQFGAFMIALSRIPAVRKDASVGCKVMQAAGHSPSEIPGLVCSGPAGDNWMKWKGGGSSSGSALTTTTSDAQLVAAGLPANVTFPSGVPVGSVSIAGFAVPKTYLYIAIGLVVVAVILAVMKKKR